MMYWTFLLATEAASAAEEGGGLFDLDATLPVMAIQFLLLMVILNAVFYKPLGNAIDSRNEYIRGKQAEARERLTKVENLTQQYEQELMDTRREAQQLIADAQAEAQKIAAQKIAEAQQEAQAQREQAQQELDQQKETAMRSLDQEVDALSRQIFDKLMSGVAG